MTSVTIYPTEFGQKQMDIEGKLGPDRGIWKKAETDTGGGDESKTDAPKHIEEQEEEFDPDQLRQYELRKMRYYFAMVECDSVDTAFALYREVDGSEFERSANTLDLRMIPDSFQVKLEPRDSCSEVPSNYKPPEKFSTKALQHSKVELTWDADNPNDDLVLKGHLTAEQLADMDMAAYMTDGGTDYDTEAVLSESEYDSDGEKVVLKKRARAKYASLLSNLPKDSEHQHDIEVTFSPALVDAGRRILDAKTRREDEAGENIFQRQKRERRERKKQRKRSASKPQDALVDSDEEAPEEMNDPFFANAMIEEGFGDAWVEKSESSKPVAKSKKSKKRRRRNGETEEEKRRKEELELLLMDDGGSDKKGFDLHELVERRADKTGSKRKKRKRKKRNDGSAATTDDFVLDAKDSRFGKIFEDPNYAIDPTTPQYHNTDAMDSLLKEVRQSRLRDKEWIPETSPYEDYVPSGTIGFLSRKRKRTNESVPKDINPESTPRKKIKRKKIKRKKAKSEPSEDEDLHRLVTLAKARKERERTKPLNPNVKLKPLPCSSATKKYSRRTKRAREEDGRAVPHHSAPSKTRMKKKRKTGRG